ncbi:MAG TPA: hypothetical protein VLM89_12245 [Phycisphaerae bacterium]|nr:hypothetical protein [Phycisphaerae bacterium]
MRRGPRAPMMSYFAHILACLALAATVSGCGPKAGIFLYWTGLVQPEKVKSAFELPKKPLLILVDDPLGLIHPPVARDALVEALAAELRDRKLADRITTNEELAGLRQTEPNFERRGAREVGRLASADIVLWLQVARFTLPDDLEAAMAPSFFGVSVKVLDATAESREDVCLWPKEREGRAVEVKVSPHDLQTAKDVREAHKVMARQLAAEVARLFYEHEPPEDAP